MEPELRAPDPKKSHPIPVLNMSTPRETGFSGFIRVGRTLFLVRRAFVANGGGRRSRNRSSSLARTRSSVQSLPQRGTTDLQTGLMVLTRAVVRPESLLMPPASIDNVGLDNAQSVVGAPNSPQHTSQWTARSAS